MSDSRKPSLFRTVFRVLLFLPVLLALGIGLWMQTSDPFGDRGMANGLTWMAALLGGFFLYVWVVTWPAIPTRVRRWGGLVTLLAVGLFVLLVRIDGVTGYLIPEVSWRFASEAVRELPSEGAAAGVDLTVTSATDFPGFFGPRRDGHVRGVTLNPDWEAQPPQELWRQEIGEGWSAFAVVNGVAVTHQQWDGDEAVTAHDLETGALLWIHRDPGDFEHFLGGNGPRATPTLDGGRVYALGAFGRLVCLDGRDGRVLWSKDLLEEYGLTPEREFELVQYGRSNSPLIVGDTVVVPAGGDPAVRQAGLVAYDKVTGELRWESPPRQVSFASPQLATVAGRPQILIVNEGSVSGHAPEDGALLWEFAWPSTTPADACSSQVHVVGEDRVFVSKGYGLGSAVWKLVPDDRGRLIPEQVWANRRAMRTKYTNAVMLEGHAYGLSDGILSCVSLTDGSRVWRDGRYGHGQVLAVGAHLLVLSEEGDLILIDPQPGAPNAVLGRFQALDGKTWNHLAFSGDVLVVRNASEAAAYRLPLVSGSR